MGAALLALAKARAVLLGVALVATGAGASTYALTSGGGAAGGTSVAAAAATTPAPAASHRPTSKPGPKATGTAAAGQGVHGACVSAVARDHAKVGGPHHNHGGAVSAAAHSCPKPSGGADDASDDAGTPGSSATHGKSSEHTPGPKASDDAEQGD